MSSAFLGWSIGTCAATGSTNVTAVALSKHGSRRHMLSKDSASASSWIQQTTSMAMTLTSHQQAPSTTTLAVRVGQSNAKVRSNRVQKGDRTIGPLVTAHQMARIGDFDEGERLRGLHGSRLRTVHLPVLLRRRAEIRSALPFQRINPPLIADHVARQVLHAAWRFMVDSYTLRLHSPSVEASNSHRSGSQEKGGPVLLTRSEMQDVQQCWAASKADVLPRAELRDTKV